MQAKCLWQVNQVFTLFDCKRALQKRTYLRNLWILFYALAASECQRWKKEYAGFLFGMKISRPGSYAVNRSQLKKNQLNVNLERFFNLKDFSENSKRLNCKTDLESFCSQDCKAFRKGQKKRNSTIVGKNKFSFFLCLIHLLISSRENISRENEKNLLNF